MILKVSKFYSKSFSQADEPAKARWDVNGNILAKMMVDDSPNPWANSTYPGHLFWHLRYKRIPSCDEKSEDKEFWKKDYDACCEGQKSKKECERWVQNRIRHISTDVGLYLKWDIDENGLPTGCKAFKNKKTKQPFTEKEFRNSDYLGFNGCEKQSFLTENGQPLYELVEHFAANQESWIETFFNAFDKLQLTGSRPNELTQGPTDFWDLENLDQSATKCK